MKAKFLAMLIVVSCGLAGCGGSMSGVAADPGPYEVYGVEDGDMLKVRAGPGTGYEIRSGLPNGALVYLGNCVRTGSTSWCEVRLKGVAGIAGYASRAYLRPA